MALLHMLKSLAGGMGFELAAAHINHGLRPEASEEQQFVADQCRMWEIPFYTTEANVRELAAQRKTSLEDAGRMARYEYLSGLLNELGAQCIATAHHRDDVAETVLLHLLRGSGLQGLRGILPRYGKIVRPLLPLGKEDLQSYLAAREIPYCLDQSNADPSFLRNRIRHQLIPELQREYNPRVVESLNQLAELARAEHAFLEQEMERYWAQVLLAEDDENIVFENRVFAQIPLAAQRRLVLRAFARLAGQAGWEGQDVEKVLDLSSKKGSAKVLQLKKTVKVNKSYDKMIFTKNWQTPPKFNQEIPVPGQAVLAESGRIYTFSLRNRGDYNAQPGDCCLDYDKLKQPLVIRSRREGDVFCPAGFSGHKKVKKYFIDQQIPFWERDSVPIIAAKDGEIYAILGCCVCQPARIDPDTKTVLIIKKETIEKNMDKLKSTNACATI